MVHVTINKSLTAFFSGVQSSFVAQTGFLIFSWLLVWQFGLLMEFAEHTSVWFPAAGLTYAALLIGGIRSLPALVLSCIVITLWAGFYYSLSLSLTELMMAGGLFAVAHIAPYFIATRILTWLAAKSSITVPQLIVTFLVSSAIFSLLTTLLVLSALVYSGMMAATEVSNLWLAFWIGDLAGVVVMGPLFSAVLSRIYPKAQFKISTYVGVAQLTSSGHYLYKVSVNLLLLTACMWLAKVTNSPESAFAIFFLAVTHMWIACTESAFYNVLSLAISGFFIALWVNVFGLMEQVMVYQFAINVVAANALFGIAIPALTADNNKLRKMVFTDSLTQVASRDLVVQRADLEILRSQKENKPLSIIVFDIDHFKAINDNFGHNAGDRALKNVSRMAEQCLRPSDILGRFGGDEFVVVLPSSTIEAAFSIAQRIRDGLADIRVGDGKVTSSFGIAELAKGDTFDDLFDRADRALYAAKQGGRDRVFPFKDNNKLNLNQIG